MVTQNSGNAVVQIAGGGELDHHPMSIGCIFRENENHDFQHLKTVGVLTSGFPENIGPINAAVRQRMSGRL